MHPKLAGLNAYLRRGFAIDDIASDDAYILVRLSRGFERAVVRLDRSDAQFILAGGTSSGERRSFRVR